MDYCCKHERRWNGKRIVPKVKRVAGPRSAASQAASLSLLCAKPATEPEAALRRLTFVYQAMLAHSSLHSPSHLALWQITMVTGMLMRSCPAITANIHIGSSRCCSEAANWLVLLAVSIYTCCISKVLVPLSNYAYFIRGCFINQ